MDSEVEFLDAIYKLTESINDSTESVNDLNENITAEIKVELDEEFVAQIERNVISDQELN